MHDTLPSLSTLPSGFPFLETLASGLLARTREDPLSLSQIQIFLPSRRACLELKKTFVQQCGGGPLLLPQLSPLGDLETEEEVFFSPEDELEVPPLISSFHRLGLLTKLIQDYTHQAHLPSPPPLSLKLAKSLIKLMDQASIEEIPWEKLRQLVPSEFAEHWQLTLEFLDVIITHWPRILKEKGLCEPYDRHHQLVNRLMKRWEANPPSHPIIAAGSMGTMPATTHLLKTIMKLPKGSVVLPGLDTTLSQKDFLSLSPCHPQYALGRFLEKVGVSPQDVALWPDIRLSVPSPRASLFAQAAKASFASPQEHSSKDSHEDPRAALQDLLCLPCASPQEEALSIALLIRQHLEVPHQRIALITADLRLVTRVQAELARWGIEIDSSSGTPLNQTPAGVFFQLCAHLAATPDHPIALLSLLKHPLFRLTQPAGNLQQDVCRLEHEVMRKKTGTLHEDPLYKLLASFLPCTPSVSSYRLMAEALSTDDTGLCHLWEGESGKALQIFLERLEEASPSFPSFSFADYPEVLTELFHGQTFRSPYPKHARLTILSPIESRLFHADVLILGGLNEGSWPPSAETDPWLNRPMRHELGFPPPERRIGLSAHDFGQAFTAPKVYLTRALKVDGTPTLASRWLERLEIYLKRWGLTLPEDTFTLQSARSLDRSPILLTPVPPLPRPPVSVRPRRLSVTQIETWMRDPYALYARKILSLTPLDPLLSPLGPAEKGSLMHAILDKFFKACPDPLHPEALSILLSLEDELSLLYKEDPSFRLFWRPRFSHFAHWFIKAERDSRLPGTTTFTEVKGKITLSTALGPFDCTAKADRIDILPDGRARIIDYKTGVPPTDQDVLLGFSPQLSLEGAIALHQGFEGVSVTSLESLQFWWVKGDKTGGLIKPLAGDPHDLAAKALEGLRRMILLFENEMTPYPAHPVPSKALKYNDYAQLARLSTAL